MEQVIKIIELDDIKDSIVGIPGKGGISLEQRKRLTIAVELVSNPSIIFMDEPTSGLDARAAAIVMRVVKNIVTTGRTIVCTIHQPSIDIFESFDEVFLFNLDLQLVNCLVSIPWKLYLTPLFAANLDEKRGSDDILRRAGRAFEQAHRIFRGN